MYYVTITFKQLEQTMTNNDLLRRLRFILDIKDTKIIKILALVDYQVPLPRVVSWLKKDEDEDFTECTDKDMLAFLDGLSIEKRGKREAPAGKKITVIPVTKLNNNLIFLKIKIKISKKSKKSFLSISLSFILVMRTFGLGTANLIAGSPK